MAKFIGAGQGVQIPCDKAAANALGHPSVESWLSANDKYGVYAKMLAPKPPKVEEKPKKKLMFKKGK